ncbi:hypothetical protein ACLEB0_18460, partial [Klebsiella pneumoniae]
ARRDAGRAAADHALWIQGARQAAARETLAARRRRAASGCNPPVTVGVATAEQQAAPADQQKLLEQTSAF